MSTSSDKSADIAKSVPVWNDDQLADIKSFDDALQMFGDAGVELTDITDYGDGFLVMDKATFVNVPFVIIDFKFADGEYGGDESEDGQFSIMRIMSKDGRKAVLTDGGTGIKRQLRQIERKGKTQGIVCPRGLTVSEYSYTDDKGKETPAKTYYLGM